MVEIKITPTSNSRISDIDFNNIPFGQICSDHMFTADYADGEWTSLEIKPIEPLVMQPTNLALHYGQSIFEGMKASITKDGVPMLFRPELHAQRFNASARRMCMPEVPQEMFLEALNKLVSLEKDWIPPITGSALYLRPFMFATEEAIGVKASDQYKFIILTLPVGPYYARPVSLCAETEFIRAAEGGVGSTKCAGNYAASLYPAMRAKKAGYDQVLWLDAREFKYIQEVGTMNIFFRIGERVITPSTKQDTILKGVTRRSVIEILESRGIDVEARSISIDEVIAAYDAGELVEVFGTGTAALIAHVDRIKYNDRILELSPDNWQLSSSVKEEINALRDGTMVDTRGWTVPVTEAVYA